MKASLLIVALVILFFFSPAPANAAPWLFVTDIHFDPTSHDRAPVSLGRDTNEALLQSAIAEMRRADPNPPVVVITGDFFSHSFNYKRAIPTMQGLARRFDRAFPHAQFVITLGNEDSGCADYTLARNAPFLRAAALAWAPLVNRHGAAPDFVQTFAHDGFYTAALPVHGVRAVVVDDVFWSPRFRDGCGPDGDGANASLDDLAHALTHNAHERRWLLLHIPPGIDAFSTVQLAHHLGVVPFLKTEPRERVLALLGDPSRNVSLVIAAHTHKFAYRVIGAEDRHPVPLLLVPSLSPIFRNAPSFLLVDVAPNGIIRNAEERSYGKKGWQDIGGLQSLGLHAFTADALLALQSRLTSDRNLRATFASLYNGGAPPEFDEHTWRGYWCTATAFSATTYRECLGEGGYGVLTRRGLIVVGAGLVGLLAIGAAFGVWFVQNRRRSRAHRAG